MGNVLPTPFEIVNAGACPDCFDWGGPSGATQRWLEVSACVNYHSSFALITCVYIFFTFIKLMVLFKATYSDLKDK